MVGDAHRTVVGVGVDVVGVDRMAAAMRRTDGLARRILGADPGGVAQLELATAFAVKEAVMKALGQGIGSLGLDEIELGHDRDVRLSGRAAARAAAVGATTWEVDVRQVDGPAGPVVVAEAVAFGRAVGGQAAGGPGAEDEP